MAGGDDLKRGLQVGVGIDAIHLRRLGQRSSVRPGSGVLVMAGEQYVLAVQRHRAFILPVSGETAPSIVVARALRATTTP